MLTVSCNGCGTSATIADGTDPDAALTCGCCPEDHHHGQNADATGLACRPITITIGRVLVGPAGGN